MLHILLHSWSEFTARAKEQETYKLVQPYGKWEVKLDSGIKWRTNSVRIDQYGNINDINEILFPIHWQCFTGIKNSKILT